MVARYKGICRNCEKAIEVGQHIQWSRRERGKAYHLDCANPSAIPAKTETIASYPVPDGGTIGSVIPESAVYFERKGKIVGKALETVPATNSPELQAIMQLLAKMTGQSAIPSIPVSEVPQAVELPEGYRPIAALPAAPELKKLSANAQWYDILQHMVAKTEKQLLRVLLIGPPSSGKTTTALIYSGAKYRVTMSEGQGIEDFIGMYQLVDGETVFIEGPIISAMREGVPIILDEIDHNADEVMSACYGFLDDHPQYLLPTGEHVTAKAGYKVIATSNANITSLPDAIVDRLEAILPATRVHPAALANLPEENMRACVDNYYKGLEQTPWQWAGKPTLRRMASYARFLPILGEEHAAKAAFGTAYRDILSAISTAARRTA